ncbi:MAG: hypothetical protein EXR51_09785 [Dehalococcoidia bacterium]|nr:hypothetical protein [Dehalococcoidia bacterium]
MMTKSRPSPASGPRSSKVRWFGGLAAAVTLFAGVSWVSPQGGGPALTVAPEVAADAAVQAGAAAVRAALAAPLAGATSQGNLNVVAGPVYTEAVARALTANGKRLPTLDPEGYSVYPVVRAGITTGVVVVGGGPLGVAYGLFGLAEDLRLDQPYLRYPIPLNRTPAITLRLVSDPLEPTYPEPTQALAWGFNAVMTEPWPALALYDAYDPAVYDAAARPQERAWVEARRRSARAQIARAKALHLKVIAPGDVVSLPSQVVALYGGEVSDSVDSPRYCIDKPRVRALLSAALDEVFRDFPEIDGIMVRTGENYTLGPLSGNSPQDPQCAGGRDPFDGVVDTARFMEQQVSGRHNRMLILRAWDLGSNGGHAGAEKAARLAGAAPRGGAAPTISFKVTETDFWRYNRLNPNLLRLNGPRMVEFQAAREYEGKGAFPNFTGGFYATGLPELGEHGGLRRAHEAGVRAAWVWAKGGGWDGPRLQSDLWVDANVYALSRLLWTPEAAPHQLATDWAALRFGRAAAPAIANLLVRSPEAVVKGFYLQCYAAKNEPWTPNLLWTRDDVVAGGEPMAALYRSCSSPADFEEALAERKRATVVVEEMVGDLALAQPHLTPQDAALIRTSLQYERSLLESLDHYLTGMFHFYRFVDSGGRSIEARDAALNAFSRLRESWSIHTQFVPLLPGAATPYRDAGMWATVEGALKRLQAG